MKFKQKVKITNIKRPSLARYAENVNIGDVLHLETEVDVWGEFDEDKLLRIDIYKNGVFHSDILQYEIKYFKEIFEYEELL